MVQFDWRNAEAEEYSHDENVSFVNLTTRSYLTITGMAPQKTDDPEFLKLADMLMNISEKISEGPRAGIEIEGYRSYRPYPLQAVWTGGTEFDQRKEFKLWIKQPLFVHKKFAKQAIDILQLGDLAQNVQFENLAEGVEIQSFSSQPLRTNDQTFQKIDAEIKERGLERLDLNSHREVYVDGYKKDHAILLRIAIEPNTGRIDRDKMAFN